MTKRKKYFLEQKLMGVAALMIALITTPILWEFDAVLLSLALALLGFWLVVSKEILVVNDYFFEVQERRNKRL